LFKKFVQDQVTFLQSLFFRCLCSHGKTLNFQHILRKCSNRNFCDSLCFVE